MANAVNASPFTLVVDGIQVREVSDKNPLVINSDAECRSQLESLASHLNLSLEKDSLIDRCLSVISANVDETVIFGPEEYVGLNNLADAHPEKVNEIIACAHYLIESIDYDEGELPPNLYNDLLSCRIALADMLAEAMAHSTLNGTETPSDEEPGDETGTDIFEQVIKDSLSTSTPEDVPTGNVSTSTPENVATGNVNTSTPENVATGNVNTEPPAVKDTSH